MQKTLFIQECFLPTFLAVFSMKDRTTVEAFFFLNENGFVFSFFSNELFLYHQVAQDN